MATPQYNRIIRKLVVGFGNLFKDINLVRYNEDMTEQSRFLVPISYAAKEDYVMRLEGDPDLDKKIQLTLPRLSFQMTGMNYDSSRKQNTNIKNVAQSAGNTKTQFSPVPYNFDFSLYLYVRNIEDGTQIIEHILPFFTPDYTIKLNLVPDMGVVKEIPVVLNNVDIPVDFEGTRDRETRIIIWTLNFTVKGFLYGGTSNSGLITHSITNVYDRLLPTDQVSFNISDNTGDFLIGEYVYQGFTLATATALAKVVSWSNDRLVLCNISGNFVSTEKIKGANTNASCNYDSYNYSPTKYTQTDVVPNPIDATSNSDYTYTTTIQEFD